MRTALVLVIGLIVGLWSSAASAWDDAGHETIAILAWRHFSPREKGAILEILKDHPHYQRYLIEGKPAGVDEGEYVFARAATWPDFVRPIKNRPGQAESPAHVQITREYHHPAWHYMDQIFSVPEGFNPHRLATLPDNAITALDKALLELKAKDTSPQQRAIALCWVEHLVGDIHQPLHAATMVSRDYPFGDTGGNAQTIRPTDEQGHPLAPMKLHAYWDQLLGPPDESYEQVQAQVTAITLHPPASAEGLTQLKEHTMPESWVEESFVDGKEVVYLNGQLKTANTAQVNAGKILPDQVPTLPDGYQAKASALAHERAFEASVRLEEMIRGLLQK